MILTLTASIMYWYLQHAAEEDESPGNEDSSTYTSDTSAPPSVCGEDESSSLCGEISSFTIEDAASISSSQFDNEDITVE